MKSNRVTFDENTNANLPPSPELEEHASFLIKLLFLTKQWTAGVMDAFRISNAWKVFRRSREVQSKLVDIFVYNGLISFGTFWAFDFHILPFIQSFYETTPHQDGWIYTFSYLIHISLVFLYYLMWMTPVFISSFFINAPWLQVISERSIMILTKKKPTGTSLKSLGELPKELASEVYTATFYSMFVLQSVLSSVIPVIGPIINYILLCWLYSLYCFEYKWSDWHLGKRLKYIEDNWAYFVGFGMVVGFPFTYASISYGFWISYAVWWLEFPLFIILAIGAGKPPQRIFSKTPQTKMALFRGAKMLNTFCLNSVVRIWTFFASGRPVDKKVLLVSISVVAVILYFLFRLHYWVLEFLHYTQLL